jgi:hypothetical protein
MLSHTSEEALDVVVERCNVTQEREEKTMTDNNVHEATRDMTTSIQEANQAIVKSAVATQERNIRYAQITLENGIEVLKSYAEDTRHLIQELVEQQKPQQAVLQAVVNTALAAQERNVKFLQSMLANGTEVLQTHGENTRDLAQTLAELSRRQQEAFQTVARGSFNTFVDFLTAPFSYYQQVLETAGSAAGREVEAAQQSTREGAAVTPKATRQAQTK